MKLEGKVAIITGSSRGIGACIARRYGAEGARVAVVAHSNLDKAEAVVKEINEPRYPSFIGIRKASKAEIPVWDLAELGLGDGEIKACDSAVAWSEIRSFPERSGEVEIIEGESMEAIVADLTDRLMDDMVI